MAKKLDLRTWLVESRLFFLPKGYYELKDLYDIIQEKVPHLCDDEILCTHSGTTYNKPEWKHNVNWALHELKLKNVVKRLDETTGVWQKLTKHS